MEYTIVSNETCKNLMHFIKIVNDMIHDGWKPLGGVATAA